MSSYCLKCRKNTESKNRKVGETKHRRIMLLLKSAVCNSKKSKFIKERRARESLSNLMGVKLIWPWYLSDLLILNTLF